MNPIWETKFNIRAFDVDASNRLKVNKFLDYFQDAASNDAERLNFGYKDFLPKGLFWVLSWIKFEFIDYPKFMDEVKIQTWGKKQIKLYSVRDYLMINSSNEIICRGTSAWLLLDIKSHRPKILNQLFPEIKMFDSQNALTHIPKKIINDSPLQLAYSTQFRYSDIDLNQHANNAKYIELMLNCFDEKFHKDHSIKTLTAAFNAESKFGDEIKLRKGIQNQENLIFYLEAENMTTKKIVFQAIVEWN